MTSVTVKTPAGSSAGTVELPAEIFDAQVNVGLLHQVVVAQLAAARQGTHQAKRRGEVSGSGKKPFKQKGTGRARQGSIRAPQYRGGGVVHGPKPRDYEQRGALSDRARSGNVHVLSAIVEGETPNTKSALAAINSVSTAKNILVVVDRSDLVSWMSLRNVEAIHLVAVDQLNTYDVLVSDDVIFTKAAIEVLANGPARGKSAKAVASSAEVDA